MARAGRQPEQRLTAPPRDARVFFALWPDASVRDALDRTARMLHRSCGGRVMRRENVHLTLVFIGDIAVERLDELKSVAGAVAGRSFEFVLDQLGYWRHNRIVWAAPQSVPGPLREIVAALESGLKQAGYGFDRRPYAPHLTLLRNAREPRVLPALDVPWPVSDFALVQSVRDEHGSRYQVIASWPLARAAR
jgi:2'-5' RNA ligase